MKKIFSALICALLTSGLFFANIFWIGEVQTQSAPKKPAIPEFTATFVAVDREISSPTQYADPYTGETVTQPGYREKYDAIEIKIKNQNRPDKLHEDIERYYNVGLYYAVRTKGYYEQYWQQHRAGEYSGYKQNDDDAYTIIHIRAEDYPDDGKVDVQVEAMHGYFWYKADLFTSYYVFEGETSGWSNTKTVTITRDSNESPNQNGPTSNSTYSSDNAPQIEVTIGGFGLFEFGLGIVLGVVIAGLAIALVYKGRIQYAKTS